MLTRENAVPTMDVAKDMELWSDAPNGLKQDRITLVDRRTGIAIQHPERRPMGHQNISALWNGGVDPSALFFRTDAVRWPGERYG